MHDTPTSAASSLQSLPAMPSGSNGNLHVPQFDSLTHGAVMVLTTADATAKAILSGQLADAWWSARLDQIGTVTPPDRPARPARPELLMPRDMPKRRKAGSLGGRIALLHALAHIELNAIDLAWDIIARFADMPLAFYDDWVRVAADEAKHFLMLNHRLAALEATYGDHVAHDGLWQAAEITAHDLAARLAIVPLVLEARGLDVTPAMIESLHRVGDTDSAVILQQIHDDEIGHVAAGRRWFQYLADQAERPADQWWQELVRQYFHGQLRPPFNQDSRTAADFPADWYLPIAALQQEQGSQS